MRKKNTIRLNESELKNIVKESVKKMVNEITGNGLTSYNSAMKKAEKYGIDKRKYVSQDFKHEILLLRKIQRSISAIIPYLGDLCNNPRINKQYMEKLSRFFTDMYYLFDESGPIADAIINQIANRWYQARKEPYWNEDNRFNNKFYEKPIKVRDKWEPINYDEGE